MLDGHTMAGEVVDYSGCFPHTRYHVRRVDGGMASIEADKCRRATLEEVDAAIEFFKTLGR